MKKRLFSVFSVLIMVALFLTACAGESGKMGMSGFYNDSTPFFTTEENRNNFTAIQENPFIDTATTTSSYFSIDANTASYPILRRYITEGRVIPKDAVRIEEMLNYFSYDYAEPSDGDILSLNASLFDTPYNSQTKLLTIGLAAQKVEFKEQNNNVVFLIDTSGSMYGSDRLGLIQTAFKLFTDSLNENDRVSIVTYAGSDSVLLEGVKGSEKEKIISAINGLEAGGSTAGAAGISRAYELARQYFIQGGNNRVILATDGDFNVGISDTERLEELIKEKAKSGVYFSVFGVGYGNYQGEKMEALALNGNGTYSYLDSVSEAKRALVEEIGGTMLTVAKDVKAGVTFNADYVESFRLLGYENKQMTQEEFENSQKDAGELGSGHTVTVTYELKMKDRPLAAGEKIGTVDIRYKPTENSATTSTEEDLTLKLDIGTECYHSAMSDNDKFVSSVVEFALLLRDSEYKADANIDEVINRLSLYQTSDKEKTNFIELVKKYKNNYEVKQ